MANSLGGVKVEGVRQTSRSLKFVQKASTEQQSNRIRFKFLEDYDAIVEKADVKVCQAGGRKLF